MSVLRTEQDFHELTRAYLAQALRPLPRISRQGSVSRTLVQRRSHKLRHPYFAEAAAADLDSNSGAAGWSNWEREFVLWAEQNGLHLDYATSEDLERVPGLLHSYQLMLSVGEPPTGGTPDEVAGSA